MEGDCQMLFLKSLYSWTYFNHFAATCLLQKSVILHGSHIDIDCLNTLIHASPYRYMYAILFCGRPDNYPAYPIIYYFVLKHMSPMIIVCFVRLLFDSLCGYYWCLQETRQTLCTCLQVRFERSWQLNYVYLQLVACYDFFFDFIILRQG